MPTKPRKAAKPILSRAPEPTPQPADRQTPLLNPAEFAREINFASAMAEREVRGLSEAIEDLSQTTDRLVEKLGQIEQSVDELLRWLRERK